MATSINHISSFVKYQLGKLRMTQEELAEKAGSLLPYLPIAQPATMITIAGYAAIGSAVLEADDEMTNTILPCYKKYKQNKPL